MGKHRKGKKQNRTKHQHQESEKVFHQALSPTPASPAVPSSNPSVLKKTWFWSVVFFLIALGFPIVFPNAESPPIAYFGWLLWGLTLALLLIGVWLQVAWKVWMKVAAVAVVFSIFLWFAHRNIAWRLRPSFVFIAPAVVFNGDTWDFTPNHRGAKSSALVQILFTDEDRKDFLYALGKNQTAIAKEEKLNRETVGKIVRSEEMNEFVEQMRSRFRGLSELAIEALRACLEQRGKEAIEIAWRVLESNGIIPPTGQAVNYLPQPQDALADEDSAVQKTLSAFGRIAMERARVFNTPFPELEEAAEQAGVKFDEE